MKKILCLLCVFFLLKVASAQSNYSQALGLRLGGGTTISYKNYISSNNIEAQLAFWDHGTRIAGLYEFNYGITNIEGLNFFVGPGVHLGWWKSSYNDHSGSEFGIDGIIGLDYGFKGIPLNLSIDWQPSLILAGGSDFTPSLGGIGIRYTF